jgi:proteasome lid subunit RPN8/RPN11
MALAERDLQAIITHAEEGYPDEVCGIVIGRPGEPGTNAVRRCQNLANKLHQEDPMLYPRDARTAYVMDPQDLMRIQLEADQQGLDFLIIYHSHTDHDAYFSRTDREMALMGGEPLWADAAYLVISVRGGKAIAWKSFRWDYLIKDFKDQEIPVLTGNR